MDILRKTRPTTGPGFLGDNFLIAMPSMKDDRFARTVIYIFAHNEDGAMGLIINQPQQIRFADLLVQIGVIEEKDTIRLPDAARDLIVHHGGPVDRSRGFVLHSDDVTVDSSTQVTKDVCLTATVDILSAISKGRGPAKALMALGYAGWGAGQLESEIIENGWLTFPATPELLFDGNIEQKYDRLLNAIGINLTHLSQTAGHA